MRKTKAGVRNDALPDDPVRLYEHGCQLQDHAIWSPKMSTSLHNSNVVWLVPPVRGWNQSPQFSSWPTWLQRLLRFADKARQRAALRAMADNKHLLDDIGLTRREALDEADRPFWC